MLSFNASTYNVPGMSSQFRIGELNDTFFSNSISFI